MFEINLFVFCSVRVLHSKLLKSFIFFKQSAFKSIQYICHFIPILKAVFPAVLTRIHMD